MERFVVLFAISILLSLLGSCVPSTSAAAATAAGETREQKRIDAYIHARMQAAHIPGLALGVVRGNQVIYLKGYGVAGPDGRSVTPQTPLISVRPHHGTHRRSIVHSGFRCRYCGSHAERAGDA
jgi:hypothetical protein